MTIDQRDDDMNDEQCNNGAAETGEADRARAPYEALSALCDGELAPDQAGFIVRRAAQDAALSGYWCRVHLVRAVLRRESPGPVVLVDRVRNALADEPPHRQSGRLWRTVMRTGLGGAMAAGVAAVALVGLSTRVDHGATPTDGASQTVLAGRSTPLDQQFIRPVQPVSLGGLNGATTSLSLREQQRINRMMIRHSQLTGGNAFIAYTPVLASPSAAVVNDAQAENEPKDSDQQAAARARD
ncbi:MAG: hypothetical protein Kow0020_11790 [Wenzhouxiangellaceae bacterium]